MSAPSAATDAQGGAVTVDGSGSAWNNNGALWVGFSDNGTLSITGGGAVSDTDSYIGYGYVTTNKVTVDGTGSRWTNTGNLYVGRQAGNGSMAITGGTAVSRYLRLPRLRLRYDGYGDGR